MTNHIQIAHYEPRKPREDELGELAFFMLAEKYGAHISNMVDRLSYVRKQLDKAYIAVFDNNPDYPNDPGERFMMVVWPTGVDNFEVYDFRDAGDIVRIRRNSEIVRLTQ